jgi:hypothetical protein
MRPSHVATALAAFTAGLTAAAALHRRAHGRRPATAIAPATAAEPVTAPATAEAHPPVSPTPDRDGVVLPFVRPAAPATASEQPVAPTRCGDTGGRTKAGAPCAARATRGGRCHHHPLAA